MKIECFVSFTVLLSTTIDIFGFLFFFAKRDGRVQYFRGLILESERLRFVQIIEIRILSNNRSYN